MEDVAVLPQQRAERAGVLLPGGAKSAQPVGNIVGQPCAAECAVGLQAPHRQFPHIHLNVLEGGQQIGESIVLKNLDRLKAAAILQDAVLRQQAVDAIQPLPRLAAAALEHKPLLMFHVPQIVRGDLFNRHLSLLSAGASGRRRPSNGLLIRHHGDAQLTSFIDLLPHSICPDRTVHIHLLAGFQQAQSHRPGFLIPGRVSGICDRREQQVRTDRDISLRKHLLRFLPRKLHIVCHIAPQRSTDISSLGVSVSAGAVTSATRSATGGYVGL